MEQSAYVSSSTMGRTDGKCPPFIHSNVSSRAKIVLTILSSAMFFTRRRSVSIIGRRKLNNDAWLDTEDLGSSDDLLLHDHSSEDDDYPTSSKYQPKRRSCCGCVIYTPNSSRFASHVHSRILQKFPFLIEMFYWIITYLFYRLTKVMSQMIFTRKVIDVAQAHGITVLEFEQYSLLSFLFPLKEHDVQHWFMEGHQTALTFLNRAYALIHIPGTVG